MRKFPELKHQGVLEVKGDRLEYGLEKGHPFLTRDNISNLRSNHSAFKRTRP